MNHRPDFELSLPELGGWLGSRTEAGVLDRMLRRAGAAELHAARPSEAAALGASGAARLLQVDELAIAWLGHLRYGDDQALVDAAAARAALAGYAADGQLPARSLHGDFALALLDPRQGRVVLAVDRIGVRNLVYAVRDRALVFATSLDALALHPATVRRMNAQAVYDYVYFHVVPGPATIVADQYRVPPGCCVVFEHGQARTLRYWEMAYEEDESAPLPALREQFRFLLRRSVQRAADGAETGAFLSGGTDSSTVGGLLGQVQQQPVRTFSIGFAVDGYDEMQYARLTSQHFGTRHHEYYLTADDVAADTPRIVAAYDQPFGNASALAAYRCALLAKQQEVGRMLAGDGGDELFGGNARYARQKLLAQYGRLPSALRRALERALLGVDPESGLLPLRKARSYIEQARPPMPDRYETYNLLDRLRPERVFVPEFLRQVDTGHPRELLREAHRPYASTSLINQMLGIDLRFTLGDSDLPKVTRMCELAGVDVAFPLLDDDLVAFSGRLRSDLKLRGTALRWFFKDALRDLLPPEVIAKRKHGFGVPVGEWMTSHDRLREMSHAALATLRSRGLFRPGFLDELSGPLLLQHPNYYGVMMWVLMVLGLWLEEHRL